ncbi:hypothetical protein C8F01DRAFT_1183807 [Mycena amicta]|nr:hypothetical protein C8F01DRAFT_1183807 [Mycena amicta]
MGGRPPHLSRRYLLHPQLCSGLENDRRNASVTSLHRSTLGLVPFPSTSALSLPRTIRSPSPRRLSPLAALVSGWSGGAEGQTRDTGRMLGRQSCLRMGVASAARSTIHSSRSEPWEKNLVYWRLLPAPVLPDAAAFSEGLYAVPGVRSRNLTIDLPASKIYVSSARATNDVGEAGDVRHEEASVQDGVAHPVRRTMQQDLDEEGIWPRRRRMTPCSFLHYSPHMPALHMTPLTPP